MIWLLAALLIQDPQYDTTNLGTGRHADEILTRDLTGDGYPDLIIQNGKELRIFHYRKGKGLSQQPDQRLRLGNHVYLWTIAHVGDKKTWSVVTASSRGIHYHPSANGGFSARAKDLVIYPSIFEGDSADSKGPARVEFAPDLNGDGLNDLFLFRPDEVFVMIQGAAASFRLTQKLPIPVDARMKISWSLSMKNKEERKVPRLNVGDATGDRLKDIILYRLEAIKVFKQNKNGTFAPGQNFELTAKKKKRNRRFIRIELPPVIADFNGDGIQDIALPYTHKGRAHVYYLRSGRRDLRQADDVLKVGDSWMVGVWGKDLNHNGKSDLVLGIIRKFGIMGGIRTFLSGRVDMELHIHHMKKNGHFVLDPDQILTFSIPYSFTLSFTEATVDLAFRPNFRADINGDGLLDLLISTESSVIHVHYGIKGTGFQSELGAKIKMQVPEGTASTRVFAADFNGDGKSDLILKHINVNEQRDYVQVKMSR